MMRPYEIPRFKLSLAVVAIASLSLAACQSSQRGSTFGLASNSQGPGSGEFRAIGTPTADTESNYRIGISDVLAIDVFQISELSATSRQVSGDGTIALPLAGTIKAAGLTPRQLESQLKSKLNRFVQDPQVTVSIAQYNSRKFTVDGAINKPGAYPILGAKSSLLSAIASAGGFAQVADPSDITVNRVTGTERTSAHFDAKAIRDGSAPDPEILAGDVIEVNSSAIRSGLQDLLPALPVASFGVSGGERLAR